MKLHIGKLPDLIAKNITKPVVVNRVNKNFLTKLVQNGPDVWPGAKILERKKKVPIASDALTRLLFVP